MTSKREREEREREEREREQAQAREKAFRAANFYLRKTGGTRQGDPFLAAPMRDESLLCQDWLRGSSLVFSMVRISAMGGKSQKLK